MEQVQVDVQSMIAAVTMQRNSLADANALQSARIMDLERQLKAKDEEIEKLKKPE